MSVVKIIPESLKSQTSYAPFVFLVGGQLNRNY